MTAKTFYLHALFGGVALMIQCPALRTGHALELRIVNKMLGGIGIVFGRCAFGGRYQHFHSLLAGRLYIRARSVAGVGQSHGVLASHAHIFAGLLNHRHKLATGRFPAGSPRRRR
jgi:hypothetical protein